MLGRIVLPIELRRTLGIFERDLLEIFVEDSAIILKKYADADPDACVFCGRSAEDGADMEALHGKKVCRACLRDFQKDELDG